MPSSNLVAIGPTIIARHWEILLSVQPSFCFDTFAYPLLSTHAATPVWFTIASYTAPSQWGNYTGPSHWQTTTPVLAQAAHPIQGQTQSLALLMLKLLPQAARWCRCNHTSDTSPTFYWHELTTHRVLAICTQSYSDLQEVCHNEREEGKMIPRAKNKFHKL